MSICRSHLISKEDTCIKDQSPPPKLFLKEMSHLDIFVVQKKKLKYLHGWHFGRVAVRNGYLLVYSYSYFYINELELFRIVSLSQVSKIHTSFSRP